ncbi:MAG: TolC family protein [Gemmatimonadota bacterium]|nr:MAG: TolC family protein [Gemmatimonadota bacterium]
MSHDENEFAIQGERDPDAGLRRLGELFARRGPSRIDATARLGRAPLRRRLPGCLPRLAADGPQPGPRAPLANIGLSRDAADAARNNFELVQDSYSRGAASIIDLLDAQNTALIAELRAANAIYDFLIQLMNVERAAGRFDFFTSAEERDAFFDRLDAYNSQVGMDP